MRAWLLTFALALGACKPTKGGPAPQPSSSPSAAAPRPSKPTRGEFNRTAYHLDLPLYWASDENGNGSPDPGEVVALLFYPTKGAWVTDGAFTRDFLRASDTIASQPVPDANLPPGEATRRELVVEDLDQGEPTLVASDFRASAAADRALVRHLLVAAASIDGIYATMRGARALQSLVPPDDPASQSLFRRDWGPRCDGPRTSQNPACSAIPGAPKPVFDAYPAAIQIDPAFCGALEKLPNAKELLDPFVVVRDSNGRLQAVPYTEAYAEPMHAITAELRAAAAQTDPEEGPLRAYLLAAAESFTTNDWGPADEAWSQMSARNSLFYLRIGPDEVLNDPCNRKAQFHLTFARINAESLAWETRLSGMEEGMERALAQLIGAPYAPRRVHLHLPDFIDVVFNAGDDRAPLGGTAGESLPNWGKVAAEGRGRTVVMSNLFADPDSLTRNREKAAAIFDVEAMKGYVDGPEPGRLSTLLHEAAHNLGPTSVYTFRGESPELAFGGKLASMLEELKAQTGALWYVDWLRKKGVVSPELAHQTYVDSLAWALRHVSNGMHSDTADEAYAQLSAIQLGFLIEDGAVAFEPSTPAANGTDQGALVVHYDKIPASIEKLMRRVGGIKARNDRAGAEKLVREYVEGAIVPQRLIAERELRFPQATLVYAVDVR